MVAVEAMDRALRPVVLHLIHFVGGTGAGYEVRVR